MNNTTTWLMKDHGYYNVTNQTTYDRNDLDEGKSLLLTEIHIIKGIVLTIVVVILMLSSCKFVLKMFSRYSD